MSRFKKNYSCTPFRRSAARNSLLRRPRIISTAKHLGVSPEVVTSQYTKFDIWKTGPTIQYFGRGSYLQLLYFYSALVIGTRF
jgi:hypothetical protein